MKFNQLIKFFSGLVLIMNFSYSAQAAQPASEVQISGPEPDLVAKKTSNEFPIGQGCEFKPKNGCSTRLICYATEQIFSKNVAAEVSAVRRANRHAKTEMAKLIGGDKKKISSICKNKNSTYTNSNGEALEQIGELCEELVQGNTEAYLEGVETLGTKIDHNNSSVSVVVGQRCEGVTASRTLRNQSNAAANGDASANQSEGTAKKGLPASTESKSYMRDDF